MKVETAKLITIPHIKLINIFLGFVYKTIKLPIKINVSIIDLIPKYIKPIEKQILNITPIIKLLITIEHIFSPLEYQQIIARNGDTIVKPYHIIIYVVGLNPLNKIVYK